MSRKQLKPVYDLLETGNNKKVLIEVDKALNKLNAVTTTTTTGLKHTRSDDDPQLTTLLLKCLRCLASLRLSKRQEFNQLFQSILNDTSNKYNNDENVLNMLMQCCKESQEVSEIVRVYENAFNVDVQTSPTNKNSTCNEDMHTLLFYAYVRTCDYVKQQQLSLKLYRQTNKIIYLYWQGISYYLMYLDDKHKNKLQLQLAQKIFTKIYSDNKSVNNRIMDINGEFKFYIRFLIENGHTDIALDLITNLTQNDEFKIGELDFKSKEEMNILEKMGKYDELKMKFEDFLSKNQDDWTLLKRYVDICNEKSTNDLITFLNNLNTSLKGPILAKIYLYEQAKTKNYQMPDNFLNENYRLLIDKFSHKPGLVYDLMFFKHLPSNLLDFFTLSGELDIDLVYKYTNYYQVKLHIGKLNENDLEKIQELYEEGLKFGTNLLKTDQQYTDDLLLVKINYLYNRLNTHEPTHDDFNRLMEQLLDILMNALKKSESNIQFKLYLMHLFSRLNAYDCLLEQYHSLEIKNIQYYSMSYHLLNNYIKSGQTLGTNELVSSDLPMSVNDDNLNIIERFFLNSKFEITNYLVNCYKYGTFTKLIELYDFLNKISQSLSLNQCLSLICLRNLLFKNDFNSFAHTLDKYFSDMSKASGIFDIKLLDIRDGNIIDLSDRECIMLFGEKNHEIMDKQVKLIKKRNYLFALIHLGLKMLNSKDQKNECLTHFVELFDRFKEISQDILLDSLNLLKLQFEKSDFFNDSSSDTCLQSFQISMRSHLDQIKSDLSNYKANGMLESNYYSFNLQLIELLSELNEKISFLFIVFYVIIRNQLTLWNEKFKKSKKKKDVYTQSRLKFELFCDSYLILISIFEHLRDFTKYTINSLSLIENNHVKSSYLNSYKHLNEQFEAKLKLLKQLQVIGN